MISLTKQQIIDEIMEVQAKNYFRSEFFARSSLENFSLDDLITEYRYQMGPLISDHEKIQVVTS